jgi:hypothetical protein
VVGLLVTRALLVGAPATVPPLASQNLGLGGVPRLLAVAGDVIVGRDGRTIAVEPARNPCGTPVTSHLVVHETATLVALAVSVPVPIVREFAGTHCGDGLTPYLAARLTEPVGHRGVTQLLGGAPIASFDGPRLAVATVLPPGCALGDAAPLGPAGADLGARWSCTCPTPSAEAVSSSAALTIDQWASAGGPLSVPVARATTVGGHRAVVVSSSSSLAGRIALRSVSWRAGGDTLVVTSVGLQGASGTLGEPLDERALLAVADGLRAAQ